MWAPFLYPNLVPRFSLLSVGMGRRENPGNEVASVPYCCPYQGGLSVEFVTYVAENSQAKPTM